MNLVKDKKLSLLFGSIILDSILGVVSSSMSLVFKIDMQDYSWFSMLASLVTSMALFMTIYQFRRLWTKSTNRLVKYFPSIYLIPYVIITAIVIVAGSEGSETILTNPVSDIISLVTSLFYIIYIGYVIRLKASVSTSKSKKSEITKSLTGIRGWLLVFSILFVIRIIILATTIAQVYLTRLFSPAIWSLLLPTGEDFNARLSILYLMEVIVNISYIVANIYCLILLFRKDKRFRITTLWILIVWPIYVLVDSILATVLLDIKFDGTQLLAPIVTILIWGSYLFLSKRVRQTMIH